MVKARHDIVPPPAPPADQVEEREAYPYTSGWILEGAVHDAAGVVKMPEEMDLSLESLDSTHRRHVRPQHGSEWSDDDDEYFASPPRGSSRPSSAPISRNAAAALDVNGHSPTRHAPNPGALMSNVGGTWGPAARKLEPGGGAAHTPRGSPARVTLGTGSVTIEAPHATKGLRSRPLSASGQRGILQRGGAAAMSHSQVTPEGNLPFGISGGVAAGRKRATMPGQRPGSATARTNHVPGGSTTTISTEELVHGKGAMSARSAPPGSWGRPQSAMASFGGSRAGTTAGHHTPRAREVNGSLVLCTTVFKWSYRGPQDGDGTGANGGPRERTGDGTASNGGIELQGDGLAAEATTKRVAPTSARIPAPSKAADPRHGRRVYRPASAQGQGQGQGPNSVRSKGNKARPASAGAALGRSTAQSVAAPGRKKNGKKGRKQKWKADRANQPSATGAPDGVSALLSQKIENPAPQRKRKLASRPQSAPTARGPSPRASRGVGATADTAASKSQLQGRGRNTHHTRPVAAVIRAKGAGGANVAVTPRHGSSTEPDVKGYGILDTPECCKGSGDELDRQWESAISNFRALTALRSTYNSSTRARGGARGAEHRRGKDSAGDALPRGRAHGSGKRSGKGGRIGKMREVSPPPPHATRPTPTSPRASPRRTDEGATSDPVALAGAHGSIPPAEPCSGEAEKKGAEPRASPPSTVEGSRPAPRGRPAGRQRPVSAPSQKAERRRDPVVLDGGSGDGVSAGNGVHALASPVQGDPGLRGSARGAGSDFTIGSMTRASVEVHHGHARGGSAPMRRPVSASHATMVSHTSGTKGPEDTAHLIFSSPDPGAPGGQEPFIYDDDEDDGTADDEVDFAIHEARKATDAQRVAQSGRPREDRGSNKSGARPHIPNLSFVPRPPPSMASFSSDGGGLAIHNERGALEEELGEGASVTLALHRFDEDFGDELHNLIADENVVR